MTEQVIRDYFQAQAPHHDAWQRQNAYYYEDLARLCRFLIPAGSSVLEVGCGTGNLLAAVEPHRGLGVDFAPAMVELARQKYPHLEFWEGSALTLDVKETFDVVLLSNLIGYLPDVQTAFERLHTACRPDTRVVVIYYNYLWEPILKFGAKTGTKRPEPDQNWLSLPDIQNILHLAGFETVKEGERLLLPKGIPVLSDAVNRFLAPFPLVRRLCLTQFLVARPAPKPSRKHFSVSIIVPARNESGNIEAAVTRLPMFGSSQEFVFVEGHSKDNTWEEIQRVTEQYQDRARFQAHRQDGIGKGDAVRKGFDAATGEVLLILDADLTTPPEDMPKFYDALVSRKGELVMGTRLVYPMEAQAMRTLNIFGNKFFSWAFSWILDQRIKDTLCGTKVLFSRDYAKIKANRHFFGDFDPFGDFDLIFGAAKLNMKILEIPVRYRDRTYGTTQISRFRHGWLLLQMTWFALRKLKFW